MEGEVAAESTPIRVRFSTGRDVLNAYWGFLSNGGLVIQDAGGLREGERVALDVMIESSKKSYQLNGHVVRRPYFGANDSSPGVMRAVIEFRPGEPQDLLLSAAWAETDNVPARVHRRYPVDRTVQVSADGHGDRKGRLLNISFGGCCVDAHLGGVGPGHKIVLSTVDVQATGVVRWARGGDLGIEFEGAGQPIVEQFVRQFL